MSNHKWATVLWWLEKLFWVALLVMTTHLYTTSITYEELQVHAPYVQERAWIMKRFDDIDGHLHRIEKKLDARG